MRKLAMSLLLPLLMTLPACEQVNQQLGLEDPAKKEARQEAEGKAVGAACRHSGRAIEDCYAIYTWVPKAAVFAGWQDMDAYMRSNNIETVAPVLPPPENPANAKKKKKAQAETEEIKEEPGKKPEEKPAEKH